MTSAIIAGQDAFDANVSDWLLYYMNVSGVASRSSGQRYARCEQARLKNSISMADELLEVLERLGRRIGQRFPSSVR